MRIVQFANFYTPTSGGLRTCVEETGRGYTALGHTRLLVVPGAVDSDEQTPAGRRVTFASPSLGSGHYRVITARRRLVRLLDEFRPDVLEISDKLGVPWLSTWARRRRVPTVMFSHERLDAILRARAPGRFPLVAAADAINRGLRKRVDTVVVASEFAAAEFARAGILDVHRVPLGVDLDTFHPRAGGFDRSTVDDWLELVMLSRLSTEKSPELAVHVLRHLLATGTRTRLTIIGDGPLRRRIERLASGLPVTFLGHVSDRAAVAQLVASADVAIAPSSAETFGLATLEALACGTPVVVPTEGALRELVRDPAAGVVCHPTPMAFAHGVHTLLAQPDSVRRRAARSVAEQFPWSQTVQRLLAVHTTLTATLTAA
jgi:alpha-1,6-mannosyltransferase